MAHTTDEDFAHINEQADYVRYYANAYFHNEDQEDAECGRDHLLEVYELIEQEVHDGKLDTRLCTLLEEMKELNWLFPSHLKAKHDMQRFLRDRVVLAS